MERCQKHTIFSDLNFLEIQKIQILGPRDPKMNKCVSPNKAMSIGKKSQKRNVRLLLGTSE